MVVHLDYDVMSQLASHLVLLTMLKIGGSVCPSIHVTAISLLVANSCFIFSLIWICF